MSAGPGAACRVTSPTRSNVLHQPAAAAARRRQRNDGSPAALSLQPAVQHTQACSTCLQYRQAKTMIGLKLPAQLRHNCNTTATTSKLTVASQMRRSCADRLIASSHAVRALAGSTEQYNPYYKVGCLYACSFVCLFVYRKTQLPYNLPST